MTVELSLDEFTAEILGWYEKYKESKYWPGYRELIGSLPAKVARQGHLDLEDRCAIADWGGNDHGIKQRLKRQLSGQYCDSEPCNIPV